MTESAQYDLVDLFSATDLAKSFSEAEKAEIAACLEVCPRKKGEPILLQGDEGTFMAFIYQGSAGITKDISRSRDASVVTLGPGGHFGELAMIDGKPRSASVVALEDMVLLCLSRDRLDSLGERNPAMAYKFIMELMKYLSQRLRETTDELVFKI